MSFKWSILYFPCDSDAEVSVEVCELQVCGDPGLSDETRRTLAMVDGCRFRWSRLLTYGLCDLLYFLPLSPNCLTSLCEKGVPYQGRDRQGSRQIHFRALSSSTRGFGIGKEVMLLVCVYLLDALTWSKNWNFKNVHHFSPQISKKSRFSERAFGLLASWGPHHTERGDRWRGVWE